MLRDERLKQTRRDSRAVAARLEVSLVERDNEDALQNDFALLLLFLSFLLLSLGAIRPMPEVVGFAATPGD